MIDQENVMDRSLWIAGILIALSAFGVKVGVAASSIVFNRSFSVYRKIKYISFIMLSYLSLFLIILFVISFIPLLSYIEHMIKTLNYGMLIHIVLAFGIFIWGLSLLKQREDQSKAGSCGGAMLLSIPCPVCALVILITVSLTHFVLSIPIISAALILFGVFSGIILLTITLLSPFRKKIGEASSRFLGVVMIIISIYFILTILIAPVYQEAKDIYQLASDMTKKDSLDLFSFVILIIAAVVLFGFGFIRYLINEKGERKKIYM